MTTFQSLKDRLLVWLSETLQTRITEVDQLCTGAAFCQLLHCLSPECMDLSSVRFQCKSNGDAIHNFLLLKAAFKNIGVIRLVPASALVERDHQETFSFLRWFKVYFDKNSTLKPYNALEARRGQSISDLRASQESYHGLVVVEDKKWLTETRQKTAALNSEANVITLITDDEDEVEAMKVEPREAEATRENGTGFASSGERLLASIRRCCSAEVDVSLSTIFVENHPGDIVEACCRLPYCLYLYMGLDLGGGLSTSVVLIGYFDLDSGVRVLRFLDSVKMSTDAVDSDISVHVDCDSDSAAVENAAKTDARRLIKTVKKYEIPLFNLAAFYCNAPHPLVSQVFVSKLQTFKPQFVSLCGIPGMAGRACQAAVLASFPRTFVVLKRIHHHYSTFPSANGILKELFMGRQSRDLFNSISAQCLVFINSVRKIASRWKDLVQYFKTAGQVEDVEWIRTQLMNHEVKLQVLFLAHALEPLRGLQELHEDGKVEVGAELQVISMLVHSYASSLLRPHAIESFLKKRDLDILKDQKKLLPIGEVDIGSGARDLLLATAVVDLGEDKRNVFRKAAATFYTAALQSFAESISHNLGDVTLMYISKILKHPENISDHKVPRHILLELGIQLGVCNPKSPVIHQMPYEYFNFIAQVTREQSKGGGAHCWAKALRSMKPQSVVYKLFMTLLALPSSLHRSQVFAALLTSTQEASNASPVLPAQGLSGSAIQRASSDKSGSSANQERPATYHSSSYHSDGTDNSSDVIEIIDDTVVCPSKKKSSGQESRFLNKSHTDEDSKVEIIVDYDADVDLNDSRVSQSTPSVSEELQFREGELVWGKIDGFPVSRWPAIVKSCSEEDIASEKRMVMWYGQSLYSKVNFKTIKPFGNFSQYFCSNSYNKLDQYRKCIFLALQEAALRCNKQSSALTEDAEELQKDLIIWALAGFQPTGPDGFKPGAAISDASHQGKRPVAKKKLFMAAESTPKTPSSNIPSNELEDVAVSLNKLSCKSREATPRGERGGKPAREGGVSKEEESNGGRGAQSRVGWQKLRKKRGRPSGKRRWNEEKDESDPETPPYLPRGRKRTFARGYNRTPTGATSPYTQPDQQVREETIRWIMESNQDIEGFCLCCGTQNVKIFHPLFKGGLCLKCKDNFTETLYRYDEDGYQSYCTICCYGMEVILCGNESCCRSFCNDCLNILIGPGTFDSLKLLDPWACYLCQPHQARGALIPREDWSIRVQELFTNNSGMEFEPHRVYPSIPANLRRPIRVLSLFDGIATGYVVLKDLGFKVERYVASEVCEDSLAVAHVNHDGKIIHIGDARAVNKSTIEQWGPFDLLIGGSPCNDLSIVNPYRKGLYEGTGRLFFEFHRVLHLLKPDEDDPRPFFWLFENVTFMNVHDKVNICRFLECNPVMVDAVRVSPAHRARHFWGNIPGMSRPIIASQKDKLYLQDCLEIGRQARLSKVRTITTQSNSLKQGKDETVLPVIYNGKEDNLWITELEKIFGFPKHYTDVRNMNRQQRQKVLGKAWSVPVIRHLFAPLKDYFACEEMPSSAPSNSCSSSPPASPEMLELR